MWCHIPKNTLSTLYITTNAVIFVHFCPKLSLPHSDASAYKLCQSMIDIPMRQRKKSLQIQYVSWYTRMFVWSYIDYMDSIASDEFTNVSTLLQIWNDAKLSHDQCQRSSSLQLRRMCSICKVVFELQIRTLFWWVHWF